MNVRFESVSYEGKIITKYDPIASYVEMYRDNSSSLSFVLDKYNTLTVKNGRIVSSTCDVDIELLLLKSLKINTYGTISNIVNMPHWAPGWVPSAYTDHNQKIVISDDVCYSYNSSAKFCTLTHIAVNPHEKRKGIATSIIESLVKSYSEVIIEYPSDEAKPLYAKLGFKEFGSDGHMIRSCCP